MIGVLAMLAGAGGAVVATQAAQEPVNVTDKAAIEKIVREYILTHPEILPEAMANLQAREMKQVVSTNRKALEMPFAGAWEGAANPDVTLVQFFDYACGYCRASRADVKKLLAEDPKLRVVYREIPILGPDSEAAARASLVVAQQGNYSTFHEAVYAAGRPTSSALSAALTVVKADASEVRKKGLSEAVTGEIKSNIALFRDLQLTGTPGWVIGDQVFNGAIGYDELKAAIKVARGGVGTGS